VEIARKSLVAATFEKAKTYVFAGMVIHNPKVGSSIPPPATNFSLPLNNLQRLACFNSHPAVANLCPKQTARDVNKPKGMVKDGRECEMLEHLSQSPTTENKGLKSLTDHGVETPTVSLLETRRKSCTYSKDIRFGNPTICVRDFRKFPQESRGLSVFDRTVNGLPRLRNITNYLSILLPINP
jgi:hypothetical protein